MKISELRDWAASEFGVHSHQEGQLLAALGPLEEWLGHLQRFGIQLELTPVGGFALPVAAPALHAPEEPPAEVNAGAIGTEADGGAHGEGEASTPGTFIVPVPEALLSELAPAPASASTPEGTPQ